MKQSFQTINVVSSGFMNNEPIPRQYSAEGDNLSPPLSWSQLPAATRELALICDDPDAPTADPWVHWVLYKLSPKLQELPPGIAPVETPDAPAGLRQGVNTGEKIGFSGPLPPRGHGLHHYHFKLFALDAPLSLEPGATKSQLLQAMSGHILAQGELIGTYQR